MKLGAISLVAMMILGAGWVAHSHELNFIQGPVHPTGFTQDQQEAQEAEAQAEAQVGGLQIDEAVPIDGIEMVLPVVGGGGFGRSISITEVNGEKTITVSENGKQYVIVEGANGVSVTYTKSYGPNDTEALLEDHPDLHMHVVGFPDTSQDSKVTVTVNVETTREAESPEALKEAFPDAYEIYEQFQNGQGGILIRGGLDVRPRVIEGFRGRFEPMPEGFQRLPIRIEQGGAAFDLDFGRDFDFQQDFDFQRDFDFQQDFDEYFDFQRAFDERREQMLRELEQRQREFEQNREQRNDEDRDGARRGQGRRLIKT